MKRIKWIMITFTAVWVGFVAQATQITDAVEPSDGWMHINGAMFSSGTGGLSPVEGASFWTTFETSTGNRGAWKLFNDTFSNETLEVTCSIGALDYSSFEYANIYLFADINEDGIYAWDERIEDGTSGYNKPSPTSGQWETWMRKYQITASTLTAGGDPVIGKKIGFLLIGGTGSSSEYDFAFDGLSIQTVPESSATLIEDAVEQGDGWTHIVGAMFSSGIGGLSPVAGSTFWVTVENLSGNRGAWKLFNETFTNETLEVTCSIGALDYSSFDFADIYLFADTDGDSAYDWSERIADTPIVSTNPVPASGEWRSWTNVYEITESTLTAAGDPVLGEKIGFFVIGGAGASSEYDFAFDGLKIQGVMTLATSSGVPYSWLQTYYSGLETFADYESAANTDSDGDGFTGTEEYLTGTNPTNSASFFAFTATAAVENGFVMTWPSVEGSTYTLSSNAVLTSSQWGVIASNITGKVNETSYTTTVSEVKSFYKVELK